MDYCLGCRLRSRCRIICDLLREHLEFLEVPLREYLMSEFGIDADGFSAEVMEGWPDGAVKSRGSKSKMVLRMYFKDRRGKAEIARHLGVTARHVRGVILDAYRKLGIADD